MRRIVEHADRGHLHVFVRRLAEPLARVEVAGITGKVAARQRIARFTSGQISPLHFRSDVPHALRAGPDETAERLRWIVGDHHLEPIEFRGDWMKARVTQPSDYCAGEAIETEESEGWVRWRSPDKGPWVWYYTRGC